MDPIVSLKSPVLGPGWLIETEHVCRDCLRFGQRESQTLQWYYLGKLLPNISDLTKAGGLMI